MNYERKDYMKGKKLISLLLGAALLTAVTGCGTGGGNDGKISVEVGNWPGNGNKEVVKKYESWKEGFEKKYPNIKIVKGNTYTYDSQTFNAKAAAGQLPAFLDIYFTEIDSMRKAGYTCNITENLKDNGLLNKINPDLLPLISDESGEICCLPVNTYAQGLIINKELFKKAGLTDKNGMPKIPQTYEQLAEYAKIIKEKTGVAGFVMPTIDNCGGWIFMNIAWSYGVNFEEQGEDGKWKATFDTPEFRNALQYIHDLRWKQNAWSDEKVLDNAGVYRVFGTGQAAMAIGTSSFAEQIVEHYGMNKDNLFMAKIPAGTEGRYSQMGGSVRMFFKGNTSEENDAGLKWLMYQGYTPEITPEIEQNLRQNYQETIDNGGIVFPEELFGIWQSDERKEKIKEIAADYANVSIDNFKDYMDFTGVIIRPEESACCQQLYAVLDGVIQEILTNEAADIDALTKTAVNDFQKNHLDKMN